MLEQIKGFCINKRINCSTNIQVGRNRLYRYKYIIDDAIPHRVETGESRMFFTQGVKKCQVRVSISPCNRRCASVRVEAPIFLIRFKKIFGEPRLQNETCVHAKNLPRNNSDVNWMRQFTEQRASKKPTRSLGKLRRVKFVTRIGKRLLNFTELNASLKKLETISWLIVLKRLKQLLRKQLGTLLKLRRNTSSRSLCS